MCLTKNIQLNVINVEINNLYNSGTQILAVVSPFLGSEGFTIIIQLSNLHDYFTALA